MRSPCPAGRAGGLAEGAAGPAPARHRRPHRRVRRVAGRADHLRRHRARGAYRGDRRVAGRPRRDSALGHGGAQGARLARPGAGGVPDRELGARRPDPAAGRLPRTSRRHAGRSLRPGGGRGAHHRGVPRRAARRRRPGARRPPRRHDRAARQRAGHRDAHRRGFHPRGGSPPWSRRPRNRGRRCSGAWASWPVPCSGSPSPRAS